MFDDSSADGAALVCNGLTLGLMRQSDQSAVNALHEAVFGPGRFARTAFRLRERAATLFACSWCAYADNDLVGSVTMSRLQIGGQNSVLLGPLAVDPHRRHRGLGRLLVDRAVASAFAGEEPSVLLVGDLPYYGPSGFKPVAPGALTLPGPVDPRRLLLAINPAFESRSDPIRGLVRGAPD